MNRFFIPSEWIRSEKVRFQGNIAHQLSHVLRIRPGESVIILDGGPLEQVVQITTLHNDIVEGLILSGRPIQGEPRIHINLYLGMTQRSKFEWVLQKGTELGLSNIAPVVTSRSLIQNTSVENKKLERWQEILREAAEQSGRGKIPTLIAPLTFRQAIVQGAKANDICLLLWENATEIGIKEAISKARLQNPTTIALLIGPEGGFTTVEVDEAIEKGWQPISLGPRILRMETAALAALTMVLFEMGEFNPPDGAAKGS